MCVPCGGPSAPSWSVHTCASSCVCAHAHVLCTGSHRWRLLYLPALSPHDTPSRSEFLLALSTGHTVGAPSRNDFTSSLTEGFEVVSIFFPASWNSNAIHVLIQNVSGTCVGTSLGGACHSEPRLVGRRGACILKLLDNAKAASKPNSTFVFIRSCPDNQVLALPLLWAFLI